MTNFGTTKDYQDGFLHTEPNRFRCNVMRLVILILTHQHSLLKSRMSVYLVIERISCTDKIDPYYLSDDHAIKLGEHLKHPFILKRIVGQSGMSYGALGKNIPLQLYLKV